MLVAVFVSLRHFDHLSHKNIKTRCNSIHLPAFTDLMTEVT